MSRLPREVVNQLLLGVERKVHRDGWDQPSMLGVLDLVTPNVLALAKMPIEIGDPAGDFINYTGQLFRADPELPTRTVAGVRNFFGMVFTCEGWQPRPGMTQKEHDALLRAGQGYADQPGSTEVRAILAIDLYARVYAVQRTRGEKATAADLDDPALKVGGQVAEGLRQMTLACAKLLPDNLEYVTALSILEVEQREVVIEPSDP